jgi:hypothetical protein
MAIHQNTLPQEVTEEKYKKTAPKYMVLVEAKHYIDRAKIDTKLNQLMIIREYLLSSAKNSDHLRFTESFQQTVSVFNLQDYDDVFLFLGGATLGARGRKVHVVKMS